MKDSWPFYDYLQHWWRLLLLCCALGILGAYLVNESMVQAKEYSATATLTFTNPNWDPEVPTSLGDTGPPQARVTIKSGLSPTQEEAGADIRTKLSQLSEYSGIQVERPEIVIQGIYQGTWALWKGIIMGAVIGLLAAIGMIYVWTDVQAYSRREQAA